MGNFSEQHWYVLNQEYSESYSMENTYDTARSPCLTQPQSLSFLTYRSLVSGIFQINSVFK